MNLSDSHQYQRRGTSNNTHQTPFAIVESKFSGVRPSLISTESTGTVLAASTNDAMSRPDGKGNRIVLMVVKRRGI